MALRQLSTMGFFAHFAPRQIADARRFQECSVVVLICSLTSREPVFSTKLRSQLSQIPGSHRPAQPRWRTTTLRNLSIVTAIAGFIDNSTARMIGVYYQPLDADIASAFPACS